ncbi:MAG: hypothetical protein U1E83_10885 [Methylotetracoccus sp.]
MTSDSLATSFPATLTSPSGLSVQVNANGSIRRFDHKDLTLNLFPGDELEGGAGNLYLRRRGRTIELTPLLGPDSPSSVQIVDGRLRVSGEWQGIRYRLTLVLAESAAAWFWHVRLDNLGDKVAVVDLVYAQDVALAYYWAIRLNEYYISQYVDHCPLRHPERGAVLAVRQNLATGGKQPWALMGSLGHASGFATDALAFFGLARRSGEAIEALQQRDFPNQRLQHEHSMAVLEEQWFTLVPGKGENRGFFGWFEDDHPGASSDADLGFVERALALPEAAPPVWTHQIAGTPVARNLFNQATPLAVVDLTAAELDALFGDDRREPEFEQGELLSFFTGPHHHVALRAKELRVLRPHGHMLRTGRHLTPDERSLTTTVWMNGVFNSLLTQGHASINRLLSTTRSYLGLFRAHGQRVLVERGGRFHLLMVPSAFETSADSARWIYKHDSGVIAVSCLAGHAPHELNLSIDVLAGDPCRFIVTQHIALNGDDGADRMPVSFSLDADGVRVSPRPDGDVGRRFPEGYFRIDPGSTTPVESVGGDELLFADGQSRAQPFLVIVTSATRTASFRITGHLIPEAADPASGAARSDAQTDEPPIPLLLGALRPAFETEQVADLRRLEEILPWFTHNALVHYLAPRGLEQFSGGAWGTRDICQGPVELLLGFGLWPPIRDLLTRVYSAQNPDGDWPQWFQFFERERDIRAGDSHGDIVFWPLLALAQYLVAAEDASVLDEQLPFFDSAGDAVAERGTVWQHVERALGVIERRRIPGTALAAYGHGDWNDSLQPVDPGMRERLCSSWTVTLHYQTLVWLARGLRAVGRARLAEQLERSQEPILADFQRHLLRDGVLAGFAHFGESGPPELLVHPSDQRTGMSYSILAMVHAIANDLLTPEQAAQHVELIRTHLLAPDGARLFDRPPPYRGGPQTLFQRAESSSFFGREIGIMYMHAHLRYAEAMARYGDAEGFFDALRKANPIAIRSVVASTRLRQANCYYSSSDAAFGDRYQAAERYDEVRDGTIPLEGGWRIYSSGAGIATRLIHQCLLGFTHGRNWIIVDPVLPRELSGLEADMVLAERPVTVVYRIKSVGHGPSSLQLNGVPLSFTREANPYRTGGVRVTMAELAAHLEVDENRLVIELG